MKNTMNNTKNNTMNNTMHSIKNLAGKVTTRQAIPVVAGIAAAIIFRKPLLRMASGLLTSKTLSPVRASLMAMMVNKGKVLFGK